MLNYKDEQPDLFAVYTETEYSFHGWFMFYIGGIVSAISLGAIIALARHF